jgi:hypothetical protein
VPDQPPKPNLVLPKVKGANPPVAYQLKYDQVRTKNQTLRFVFRASITALVLSGLIAIAVALLFNNYYLALIVLLLMVAAIALGRAHDRAEAELKITPLLVPLHSFNTDFTAPLADDTTLQVTVHFQIPSSVGDTEQLNRITENILVPFCLPLSKPPVASQIEEHLQTRLVQFQDENNIPVLRVNVPIVFHVRPEKKKVVDV